MLPIKAFLPFLQVLAAASRTCSCVFVLPTKPRAVGVVLTRAAEGVFSSCLLLLAGMQGGSEDAGCTLADVKC